MKLIVGPGSLGTPEEAWRASGVLDGLDRWELPEVGHVLVVAPHPDDEVLGAGAVLRLLARAGARVDVLAVTDGEAARPGGDEASRSDLARQRCAEREVALARLGVEPASVVRMRVPDGEVAGHESDVSTAVAQLCRPDTLVLAPWSLDGHPDHDAAGRASVAAAAQAGATVAAWLLWAWHWADPSSGIPLHRSVRCGLDRRTLAAKRWAVAAYRSQVQPTADSAGGTAGSTGGTAVLPPAVLRRSLREFEVFLPGDVVA